MKAAHENVLDVTELCTRSWQDGEVRVMCILPSLSMMLTKH